VKDFEKDLQDALQWHLHNGSVGGLVHEWALSPKRAFLLALHQSLD
jgi:hypothetical protein